MKSSVREKCFIPLKLSSRARSSPGQVTSATKPATNIYYFYFSLVFLAMGRTCRRFFSAASCGFCLSKCLRNSFFLFTLFLWFSSWVPCKRSRATLRPERARRLGRFFFHDRSFWIISFVSTGRLAVSFRTSFASTSEFFFEIFLRFF